MVDFRLGNGKLHPYLNKARDIKATLPVGIDIFLQPNYILFTWEQSRWPDQFS